MKLSNTAFGLTLALLALPTGACSTPPRVAEPVIRAPAGLSAQEGHNIEKIYLSTQCVTFRKNGEHDNAGFICWSSSRELIADFGIAPSTTGDGTPREFHVATGMSMYGMTSSQVQGHLLFTAETDCDDGNGPTYRATATCHVAYMPLEGSHFVYSNFVVRSHTSPHVGVNTDEIMNMWNHLDITAGSPPPQRANAR